MLELALGGIGSVSYFTGFRVYQMRPEDIPHVNLGGIATGILLLHERTCKLLRY